jgi:hypothetical protein
MYSGRQAVFYSKKLFDDLILTAAEIVASKRTAYVWKLVVATRVKGRQAVTPVTVALVQLCTSGSPRHRIQFGTRIEFGTEFELFSQVAKFRGWLGTSLEDL